jgi:hypothetical protein
MNVDNFVPSQRQQESILCKKQCPLRDTRCLANSTQTITYQHIAGTLVITIITTSFFYYYYDIFTIFLSVVPTIKRLEKPMVR